MKEFGAGDIVVDKNNPDMGLYRIYKREDSPTGLGYFRIDQGSITDFPSINGGKNFSPLRMLDPFTDEVYRLATVEDLRFYTINGSKITVL